MPSLDRRSLARGLSFLRFAPAGAALTLALASGCAAPAAEDARTKTDEVVVDDGARTTSEALVDEARVLADVRLRGDACAAGATEKAIVGKLEQALAVRDTVYFRENVIGRTASITLALRDSLALHAILGRVVVGDGAAEGLADALSAGVTLHGPAADGLLHASRLRFDANGEATRTEAGRDALGNVRWSSTPTTWSVDAAGRLTVGGASVVVSARGADVRLVTASGEALVAVPDECPAP